MRPDRIWNAATLDRSDSPVEPPLAATGEAIVQVASKPEFREKYMIQRGLVPVLDTPEHYAEQLALDRKADYKAVKASGLYPDVK